MGGGVGGRVKIMDYDYEGGGLFKNLSKDNKVVKNVITRVGHRYQL